MRYTVTAVLLASTIFTTPAFASVNAADYGVTPSSADNADALQRAFDAAKGTPDRQVILPPGNIVYSRQVRADGVRIVGSGNTVMAPSNPENQRIILTGNSPSISNVKFAFKPVVRNGAGVERSGVWVEDADNFSVTGLTMNGAAYGVPPKGQGGGNIFIRHSTNGTISNNALSYTMADAIHMTGGSHDIEVTGNRVDHAGDDSIAAVNYGDGTGGVQISGNTVTDNLWGRGITAVGASDVQITGNYIKGNSADLAGVYVASEPAYNTAAPRNVVVEGNTVQDTGGPGKGHGQIMLWSGKGPVSNVTIRDNEVRDSKRPDLAVVLSGSMSGITLEGNQIDGEISRRNGGSYNGSGNTTNDASMAAGAPVPAGPLPSGQPTSVSGDTPSLLERNFDGLASNAADTDDAFWSTVEGGDAAAMRRLNDLVSAGILVRQGNQIINRVTGQVTSTVNRTIGNAVDAVLSPVEDTVSSLGDAIICRIGGGWISALVGINVCAAKQLKIQGRQLEIQRAMNASGTADTTAGISGLLNRILPGLGNAGFLSNETQIRNAYERQFPDAFAPMSGDDLVAADNQWADHTRNAQMAALELQNRAVQEQAGSLERARDYAAAGRDGPGIRAELQAANAIQGEQVAAINSLTAATVANHRATTEIQLRNEAKKAAANATAEEFMSNLATCGNCNISRPFLGN
jgi:conjugal transfer/entry exclusion protein